MSKFCFERECRTPFSECYTVLQNQKPLGRLDLHFTDAIVHATLSVVDDLSTEEIQSLIDAIDRELVDAVGISRQEIIVHVHQGRDLGVFSTRSFNGNGGHQRTS